MPPRGTEAPGGVGVGRLPALSGGGHRSPEEIRCGRSPEGGEDPLRPGGAKPTPPRSAEGKTMDDIRLDKYLWAVRVFKTRSDAADAIRTNKVTVNGSYAKPSREVKIGDVIAVRKMQVTYSYKVLDLVSSRQPAKNVPAYCLNITPQEELDKLNVPRETIFVFRDRGTGRPTKKERRELDTLMDEVYYGDDEEE